MIVSIENSLFLLVMLQVAFKIVSGKLHIPDFAFFQFFHVGQNPGRYPDSWKIEHFYPSFGGASWFGGSIQIWFTCRNAENACAGKEQGG